MSFHTIKLQHEVIDMYKVLDVFRIADMLLVTLEGNCEMLSNGSKLADDNNKIYDVVSVAMPEYKNPSDISKSTTILVTPCDLKKGVNLRVT